MRNLRLVLFAACIAVALVIGGCEEGLEGSGEHGGGYESVDGDEESGAQYGLNDEFEQIRSGARLMLSYDQSTNAFTGVVENTTGSTLGRVRVEVHLSNGIELGPTTPIDLGPAEMVPVELPAGNQSFETWSAHAEVG